MDPEAPMRGNRRGFRRWLLRALFALPVAAVLLAYLWLASPLGRGWIGGKIQRRTGLETHVGGVSVSPWNGVSLNHVELLQPPALRPTVKQPLAKIDNLRLCPIWRSWLRGRLELQSIELDSPAIVIPLELLADIARSQAPAAPPPTAPPAAPPTATAPPVAVPATPAVPPPAPETKPAAPPVKLPPTGWVRLKNASFTLLSASSGKHWFEVAGVTGAVPVSGSPAESSIRVRSISANGESALTETSAPLDWKPPFLAVKPFDAEIHGLKCTVAGRLAMLSGIPLQIEAQFPKQKPATIQLPNNGRADADAIAANVRFRGLMLAPGTWQGEVVAEALAPSASIAGHDAKFDKGSAITILRGGMLSCVDARLIGDELSLLGNATLLADGRAAGALRLVAPPDAAAGIVSRVFPNIQPPPALTPLSSPQRSAFDLEAFGNIRQIFLRLGKDGPVVELNHKNSNEPQIDPDGR